MAQNVAHVSFLCSPFICKPPFIGGEQISDMRVPGKFVEPRRECGVIAAESKVFYKNAHRHRPEGLRTGANVEECLRSVVSATKFI